jgi:hypothetical protein
MDFCNEFETWFDGSFSSPTSGIATLHFRVVDFLFHPRSCPVKTPRLSLFLKVLTQLLQLYLRISLHLLLKVQLLLHS